MDYLRLEELCKEKNISTSKLAEKVGVSKGNTSTWKKGGNPSLEVLSKMAKELDCTIDYLLGNEVINLSPSKKYNALEVLEASKADYLSNGCRMNKSDTLDLEEYSIIAKYLNCDPKFLISASKTEYKPVEINRTIDGIDTDMVFDIINIMSYIPGNDDERVMQIQISRIVLYNLEQRGFNEGTIREYNAVASKTLDFLYSGEVDYKKLHAYGLRFNDLRSLNVRTGVSYQYMFTGIKNSRDKD
ncbi:MAG: helix-turn-helix domain-containing protein [Oscillospiraceae bacterium]